MQGALVVLNGAPETSCAAAWNGLFDQPAQPAPPLVTCVLPSGVLAVLPGDSSAICDKLGLPRWTGRFRDDPTKVIAFTSALVTWNQTNACSTGTEAAEAANREIATTQLAKWAVRQSDQPNEIAKCAGFLFDFSNRVVFITFNPNR